MLGSIWSHSCISSDLPQTMDVGQCSQQIIYLHHSAAQDDLGTSRLSCLFHQIEADQRKHFAHATHMLWHNLWLELLGLSSTGCNCSLPTCPKGSAGYRESLFINTSHNPYKQNSTFQSPILILVYNLQAENLTFSIIMFDRGLYSAF